MKKLLIPALIFLALHLITLNGDHHWGDDFAQYLIHARNILNGAPYMSGIGLDPHAVLPPGLPLLMAGLMAIFGPDLAILKMPNVIFWLLTALLLYGLLKPRIKSSAAFLIAAVFLSSYYFFSFKQHILSDVPFMVCTTAALYALTKYDKEERVRWLVAGFACVLGAVLMRWAGVILLGSVLLYYAFVRTDKRAIAGCLVTAALTGLVIWQVGFTAQAYQKALVIDPAKWLQFSLRQLLNVPVHLAQFYFPSPLPANYTALAAEVLKYSWFNNIFAVLLLAGIIWRFGIRLRERSISLIAFFFAGYFFCYLLWWIPADGRYLLPIIGFFPLFVIEFLQNKLAGFRMEGIIRILLGVMIAFNLINIVVHFNEREEGIHAPEALAMADWIKQNMREDEHFMFPRPRALTWLTGRTGAAFVSPQTEDSFVQRARSMHVDYVILGPDGKDFIAALRSESIQHEQVYRNSRFVIYKISKP